MACLGAILLCVVVFFAYGRADPPAAQCGQTPIDNPLEDRVIGGHQGAAGNWPWLVWMKVKREDGYYYQCTGTILSQKHVLTAASCVTQNDGKVVDTKGITIVGGVNKIAGEDTSSGKREERTVKSITVDGDAAILELAEQWPDFLNSTGAPKNRYFQPVCLPVNWKENIGEYGVVAGFGTNETAGTDARIRTAQQGVLRENIVPYREWSVCVRSGDVAHNEKYICAVGNQRDVAMGDEGGPLMTNIYGQWYQVGIVTRYRKDVNPPAISGLQLNGTLYDRITQHCEWISKTVGGAAACLEILPDPLCDPVFNPCSSTSSP